MSLPRFDNNEEEMVELLRQIAGAVSNDSTLGGGGGGGDTHIEETYNIEAGAAETSGEPVYYTTGPSGVLLDEDEWEDLTFPFAARTLNVRFTEPIVVAFDDPDGNPYRQIPLEAQDDPFTIGGDGADGIDTDEIWLKRAENTESDPVVHIIAYQ